MQGNAIVSTEGDDFEHWPSAAASDEHAQTDACTSETATPTPAIATPQMFEEPGFKAFLLWKTRGLGPAYARAELEQRAAALEIAAADLNARAFDLGSEIGDVSCSYDELQTLQKLVESGLDGLPGDRLARGPWREIAIDRNRRDFDGTRVRWADSQAEGRRFESHRGR